MVMQRLLGLLKESSAKVLPVSHEPAAGPYIATEDDIFKCFRLLLGRSPSPKEWHGHRLSAGQQLQVVVNKFLSSAEFKAKDTSSLSMADTAHEIIELDELSICISSIDEVCGLLRTAKTYEPGVMAVIDRVLTPGMTFVDIGANIGYFTVLASKKVTDTGKVFAIEPYPYNIKLIQKNIALNQCNNVEILPFALSKNKGFLSYDDSAGNSGNVGDLDSDFANLLKSTVVYCMPLDDLIDPATKIDLIKMDIEGAEYLALQGMQRTLNEHTPIIISEISDEFLKRVSSVSLPQYLELLLECEKYNIAVIKTPEQIIPCGRDIQKVVDIYTEYASMCMDVVVYTDDKKDLLRLNS
jgi:FkbM family methyltransferase